MQGHMPYGMNYGEIPIPPRECNPPPMGMHPPIISPMAMMPPRMPSGTFFPPPGMPSPGDLFHPAMYNVVNPTSFASPAPPYIEPMQTIPNPPPTASLKDGQKHQIIDQNLGPILPAAQRGPTVYIGHLSPECDDVLIRQILQECGRVMRWTRTTDPATKRPSTFGFCEFESPLGVIRAVNCLNNLVIDGQALIANCEDRVKEGLNQWRVARKHKLQEENPSKSMMVCLSNQINSSQEIENDIEREEERIKTITQKIAADWNLRNASNREPVEDPEPVPEPSPIEIEPVVEATENLREKWYESLVGFVDLYGTMSLSSKTLNRIRSWNNRTKENRMEFRKRLQNWQRKEPYLAKEFKSFKEYYEKQMDYVENGINESKFKRLLEYDLKDIPYYLTTDGAILEDIGSRRHYELMEQIRLERAWDKHDRKLEQEEIKKKALEDAEVMESRKKRKEDETPEPEKTEQAEQTEQTQLFEASKEIDICMGEPEVKTNESTEAETVLEMEPKQIIEQILPQTQEDINTVVEQTATTSTDQANVSEPAKAEDKPKSTKLNLSGGLIQISLNSASTKKESLLVLSSPRLSETAQAFVVVEEEEEKPETVRKHAPLSKLDAPLHRDNKTRLAPEVVMELAAQVPKDPKDVFAFKIDWSLFETNNLLRSKVVSWIDRKIYDFLGEEEPQLVDMIVSKLAAQLNPQDLIKELEVFIDEAASGFILKLWKLLIFEHLRLKEDDKK